MRLLKAVVFSSVLACCALNAFAGNKPLEVRDAAGRIVKFARLPQRIVVIGRIPFMTLHLLYAFPEGRQRLVASERKGSATASDFLPLVDPAFARKPVLAPGPNIEEIAGFNPDLVLLKGTTIDKVSESLGKIGIQTFYLALETPDQFLQDVANLGLILGNARRGEEIQNFYKLRLERLRKGLAGVSDSRKPRVLLVEYSNRGNKVAVQVPSKSWMQTLQVQIAGGNPVWLEAVQGTEGYSIVNFEQIARWNPEKIFVVVWYLLDPPQIIRGMKADPQWSALQAVAKDQVYAFPTDIFGWDTADVRWILGVEWLATRMHPDRFKDIDLRSEVLMLFGELFGMSRSAIESGILPQVKLDVH